MQSTIALALSFLALTASAAPTPSYSGSTVSVQFSNDVTGHNGDAAIPLDGSHVKLGSAYANTNLENDGTLFVTSVLLVADFENVTCDSFKPDGTIVSAAHLADPAKDFAKFGLNGPVDWQEFTIACKVLGY